MNLEKKKFDEVFKNRKWTLGLFMRPNQYFSEVRLNRIESRRVRGIETIQKLDDFRNVDNFHRGKMFSRELWSESYYLKVMKTANLKEINF